MIFQVAGRVAWLFPLARGPPGDTHTTIQTPFQGGLHAQASSFCVDFYAKTGSAFPWNERTLWFMNHLLILPEFTYAGHCESGSSNKDWVACLAVELDEQVTTPPPALGETDEVVYLSVFGPHGAGLRLVPPKRLPLSTARKLFKQKCNEKDGEAYAHVDFAPFLPQFGSPLGLTLTAPEAVLGASGVRRGFV